MKKLKYSDYFEVIEDKVLCKQCNVTMKKQNDGSTNCMRHHLLKKHPDIFSQLAQPEEKKAVPKKPKQSLLSFSRKEDAVRQSKVAPIKVALSAWTDNGELSNRFDQAVTKWIVCDGLPPTVIEGHGFKSFVNTIAPRYKPKSRRTICRRLIPQLFLEYKERLVDILSSVRDLSLTCDAWSSSENGHNLFAITGHFLDNSFHNRHIIIGAFSMKGSHSGKNMAIILRKALSEYGVENKIHMLVRDGASSMIKTAELADMKSAHCFNHILHLAIRDGLETYPGKTLIESLKTIVRKIRKSGLDREDLLEASLKLDIPPRMLLKHIDIRWSSLFQMLKRFIEQQPAVEDFLKDHLNYPQLSACDWSSINRLYQFLEPLNAVVVKVQGRQWASISVVYPLWIVIVNKYNQDNNFFRDIERFRETFLASFSKRMDAYVSDTPDAIFGTLLDPRFKDNYFDDDKAQSLKALLELTSTSSGETAEFESNNNVKRSETINDLFAEYLSSQPITHPEMPQLLDLRTKFTVIMNSFDNATFRRPKNTDSDGDGNESKLDGKKNTQVSLESDSLPEGSASNANRKKKLLRKKRSLFMDVDVISKPSSSKTEHMEVDSNGFESQISSSEDERAGDCEADDEQSDWVGYSINDPDFFNPVDRKARKNKQLKLELSQLEKRLERFALSRDDGEMGLEFKIKDRPNSAHLHRLLLHYRLEVVKRQRGNVVLRRKANNCTIVPECE